MMRREGICNHVSFQLDCNHYFHTSGTFQNYRDVGEEGHCIEWINARMKDTAGGGGSTTPTGCNSASFTPGRCAALRNSSTENREDGLGGVLGRGDITASWCMGMSSRSSKGSTALGGRQNFGMVIFKFRNILVNGSLEMSDMMLKRSM